METRVTEVKEVLVVDVGFILSTVAIYGCVTVDSNVCYQIRELSSSSDIFLGGYNDSPHYL